MKHLLRIMFARRRSRKIGIWGIKCCKTAQDLSSQRQLSLNAVKTAGEKFTAFPLSLSSLRGPETTLGRVSSTQIHSKWAEEDWLVATLLLKPWRNMSGQSFPRAPAECRHITTCTEAPIVGSAEIWTHRVSILVCTFIRVQEKDENDAHCSLFQRNFDQWRFSIANHCVMALRRAFVAAAAAYIHLPHNILWRKTLQGARWNAGSVMSGCGTTKYKSIPLFPNIFYA